MGNLNLGEVRDVATGARSGPDVLPTMPSYEIFAIIRSTMTGPEIASMYKGIVTRITNVDGVVRNIKNMGVRPLPYRIRRLKDNHYEGRYMVMQYDGSPKIFPEVRYDVELQPNVVRMECVKISKTPMKSVTQQDCAWLQPPPQL